MTERFTGQPKGQQPPNSRSSTPGVPATPPTGTRPPGSDDQAKQQAQQQGQQAKQQGQQAQQQGQQAKQQGQQAASPVDQIKQQGQQAKQQGEQAAGSIAEQVRQQAMSQVQTQKERATEGLGSMALALRQTSQQLREQEQAPVARYAEKGAEQIEHLSSYLRQHDIGDVVTEVERFARRQPAVFLGATFGLGFLAARFLKSSGQVSAMTATGSASRSADVEQSIEVKVPLRTAYNQWTQFEDFPKFMEGVEEVRQVSDKSLHWRAEIAGKTEAWDAVITDQVPDQRIAWRNTSGAKNAGRVTFQAIDPATTRVTLWMEYQPEGVIENIGSALGFVERRVQGDLKRFKEFIESRGMATGAWRGEVRNETVTRQ